jgi:hypothetical protein
MKKKRALERRRGEALHYVGGRLPPPARAGARGARRRTVGRQRREGVINQICGGWEGQRTGGRRDGEWGAAAGSELGFQE